MDNTEIEIEIEGLNAEESVTLHNEIRECLIKATNEQSYAIQTKHNKRIVRTSCGG